MCDVLRLLTVELSARLAHVLVPATLISPELHRVAVEVRLDVWRTRVNRSLQVCDVAEGAAVCCVQVHLVLMAQVTLLLV